MWEVDLKENWALKNWCFPIVVLEKTLESPLNSKELKSVNPKGNQHWAFIGKTNAEAEAPTLWPPDVKSQLIGKVPYLEKIEGRKRDNRRQDSRMASSTEWTWVWANSRRWWKTGQPGMLKSMGSQRVGHDWVTEQQQLYSNGYISPFPLCLSFFFFYQLFVRPPQTTILLFCISFFGAWCSS